MQIKAPLTLKLKKFYFHQTKTSYNIQPSNNQNIVLLCFTTSKSQGSQVDKTISLIYIYQYHKFKCQTTEKKKDGIPSHVKFSLSKNIKKTIQK